MPVEIFPGVSDDFVKLNQKYYNDIPDDIKTLLNDKGVEFQIGEKLTQVRPDLKGVTPRGWPEGSTWDSTEGCYDFKTKKVVNCETNKPLFKTAFSKSSRPEFVFKHETGHAVDDALDDFSKTEEFVAAHRKDVAKIITEQKERYTYFTQAGEQGAQETFAEIFADLIGADTGWSNMPKMFPNTMEVVKSKLGL